MKLDETGCYFTKKNDGSIWFAIYSKTNHILKKHPSIKLVEFNEKTKEFKEKKHSPNKVWFISFDKTGRDYVATKDYSYTEFEKMIKKDSEGIYNYSDYAKAADLYDTMKEAGIKSPYTKKWFEDKYKFIQGQLDRIK